ncbi:hypothetical protein [Methylobacterium sp. CM6257]|jgi:hypothetical protein
MIRSAVALVFLATPVIAAPAHRQPTPATVQQPGADPARPASADEKAQAAQAAQDERVRSKVRKDLDARQKAMDARTNQSIGSICHGC